MRKRKEYSKEEFVMNSDKKHNKKYNYDNFVYVNTKTKGDVYCNKIDALGNVHGFFSVTPHHHLRGCGCPKCDGKYKTTELYVAECNLKHKNLYTYKNTAYKKATDIIIVTCSKHGNFKIQASKHLSGQGCPKCYKEKRKLPIEILKNRIDAVHGNVYDYPYLIGEYENQNSPITIICKKHGIFKQSMDNHLRGQNCPLCSNELKGSNIKKDNETFIKDSETVHGDKYDYSETEYKSALKKVCIICHEKSEDGTEHGMFWQTPNKHLQGRGCPKCANNIKLTTEGFIEICKTKHNEFYDYSLSEYKGNKEKICVICPVHGEFWQIAGNHMSGHKCPSCVNNISKSEIMLGEFIKENYKGIIEYSKRGVLSNNQELDIYLPDLKIAFEFDGLYWHSDLKKTNDYHLNKTIKCKEIGIKLIHIFEDEWVYDNENTKNKIIDILNGNFKEYNYNGVDIQKAIENSEIIYSDRRWTDGVEYKELGFKLIETKIPNFFFVKDKKRNLVKGDFKIYDCGYNIYQYAKTQ